MFAKEEFFDFKTKDELTIHYSIIVPDNFDARKEKLPVLFHLHGGPESQYRPVFRPELQFLANFGRFLIVNPNVRGSTGFGKQFLDADCKEKRILAIRDVHDTAMDVAKRFADVVDIHNFFLIGTSYGGYLSVATSVFYPELAAKEVKTSEIDSSIPEPFRKMIPLSGTLFHRSGGIPWKGSISHAGVLDFLTFFEKTSPSRRALRKEKYGDFENETERSQILQFLSPISHLNKINTPVFVIQGKNDPRVPVAVAEQFFEKIQKMNHNSKNLVKERSKILLLEDEGHGFSNAKNKIKVYMQIHEWLRQRLRDEV